MNNKPDLRLSFDADQPLASVSCVQRSWLPVGLPRDFAISHQYWLTRGARGISWHRSGLVSRELLGWPKKAGSSAHTPALINLAAQHARLGLTNWRTTS